MKKFMLTLAVMAFACSTVMAQNQAPIKQHRNLKEQAVIEKHECKDHKDGQPCNKPADQQCPDCKEMAKKN